jgi:hypothetical protein
MSTSVDAGLNQIYVPYTGVPRGVVWGVQTHPRNSEVLKKPGQIPSSVEYNL